MNGLFLLVDRNRYVNAHVVVVMSVCIKRRIAAKTNTFFTGACIVLHGISNYLFIDVSEGRTFGFLHRCPIKEQFPDMAVND